MLDLGSTSFVMSPEAAKGFWVPVVKRKLPMNASDVGGQIIETQELFMIPLALTFGNHRTLDIKDHVFEVMKTSKNYDTSIPAGYWCQQKTKRVTAGHLHYPDCGCERFGHGCIRQGYTITYDKRIALRPYGINIGAVVCSSPSSIEKLPIH